MSPPRRSRGDYSPRKDDRRDRDRDYDRRDRTRSPVDDRDREPRDRDTKDREDDPEREREPLPEPEEREGRDEPETVTNGDERKGMLYSMKKPLPRPHKSDTFSQKHPLNLPLLLMMTLTLPSRVSYPTRSSCLITTNC